MPRRAKLAVILHADVVGSTAMVQRDEGLAHERITDAFQRLSATVRRYGGDVHEIRGDALLAEFARASDAACAALAFQQVQESIPDAGDIAPQLRIGISLGEVVVADGTVTGAGVVLAQRIEQLCEPGGVRVTEAIREALPARLPLDSENLGKHRLKGFEKYVRVYALRLRAGASAPVPDPRSPVRATRRVLGTALAALIAGAAVLIVLRLWNGHADPVFDPTQRPSVAVLPFDNLSGDPAQDYFADGLTDDLILDLSKVSGLFVIARNSTFTFKGRSVRINEVAKDLGVRYVVEGSVRRAGGRIRVNAQLIDGATSHRVWGERYDRDAADVFTVQDDLVGEIVSALAVRLTEQEASVLAHRPAPDLEAYELYLRARDGYLSRDHARMRESLDLFARATTLDPDFARAHSGLAQLAADMWRLNSVRGMASSVSRQIAEDAARRAMALDPRLPGPFTVLALLSLTDSNHAAAREFALRAIELDPNNADAYTTHAVVLGYSGDHPAALEAIRAALRLNPRPPTFLSTYHGWVLFFNRRYADAIAVLEPVADTRDRGLADAPREILAMAYAEAGEIGKAHAQIASLIEQETFPNLAWYRTMYSYHARPSDLEFRLAALRKAGMPEWPLGFEGDAANRLGAQELSRLIIDTTWSGLDAGRKARFIQEFSANGNVAYAGPQSLLSGTAYVEDGSLCERFEGFTRGMEFCGAVYRNPAGAREGEHEYVYVNPVTVRYFSVQR